MRVKLCSVCALRGKGCVTGLKQAVINSARKPIYIPQSRSSGECLSLRVMILLAEMYPLILLVAEEFYESSLAQAQSFER
jgi:hypothetical protein